MIELTGFSNLIIKNGDIHVWGRNNVGQLGTGDKVDVTSVKKLNTGELKWKYLSSSSLSTFAITEDGDLYAWGNNGNGQLGNDTLNESLIPIKIGNSKWKSVYTNGNTTFAIDINDDLYGWGLNSGQKITGGVATYNFTTPRKIGNLKWKSVSYGAQHGLGITTSNDLYVWGGNAYGQFGNGTTTPNTTNTQSKIGSSKWKKITSGLLTSYGIDDNNDLYAWGRNNVGQIGDGTLVDKLTPSKITNLKWLDVKSSSSSVLAITIDNDLYVWGRNEHGQLGTGNSVDVISPVKIEGLKVASINIGSRSSLIETIDGSIYITGDFSDVSPVDNSLIATNRFRYLTKTTFSNKSLILHNDEYKKWNESTGSKKEAIPIMTSNSNDEISIVASSNYDPNDPKPYMVFDGGITTTSGSWSTLKDAVIESAYIQIDFLKESKSIDEYHIFTPTNTLTDAMKLKFPINLSLQGSDDGVEWFTLHTKNGETWNTLGEVKKYTFKNEKKFKKYRINLLKNNGGVGFTLYEIKMFESLGYPSWQTVSTTLPTVNQFFDDGMNSLSPILDRKVMQLEPQEMTLDSTAVGEGKVYRKKVNLNKYFDLRTITTETRNS